MTKSLGRLAGFVALALFVVAPVAASAHSIEQRNSNTGNNSRNRNRASITETHTKTTVKTATIHNVVVFSGNTGGNSSHHNTEGGDTDSGDIRLNVTIRNNVN